MPISLLEMSATVLNISLRAQLLQTQIRALEEITTLAIADPHIRRVLDTYRIERYLSPAYSEPQLYLASAKALISVKNNEVHTVWSRFRHLTTTSSPTTDRSEPGRDGNEVAILSKSIRRFIRYAVSQTCLRCTKGKSTSL